MSYPLKLGRFRVHDSLGVRDDRAAGRNTLALPTGTYEAEADGDELEIFQLHEDGERRFVCGVSAPVRDDGLEQRLREPQFDLGNSRYILSLPSGEYEAEDAGEMMSIYRLSSNEVSGERELIASVPAGSYRIESDDAGAHLYRLSDDEPERVLLADEPVRVCDHDDGTAALKRLNERNARRYGSTGLERQSTKPITSLADLNARNREIHGR